MKSGQKEQRLVAELLRKGSVRLGLHIDNRACRQLEKYYRELLRWSRKVNLIGKKQSAEIIIENHFLDSLVLLPYLQEEKCTLVDIGTGAGFPGLVCKTALPELRLTLVEPRLKRVSFLRHLVRTLNLEGITILPDRVEDIAPDKLSCSHITSRAVADIEQFVLMIEGRVKDEVDILCMKGPKWQEELEQAQPTLKNLDIFLTRADQFTLPFSGAERAVLTFRRGVAGDTG